MSEPPHDGAERGADRGTDEPVGDVSDEAVKLFAALADWARDHGSDLGQSLSGLATHAVSAAQEVDEHLATGSADCTYCPICRALHVVRQTRPEVRAHLGSAAASLVQAAAGMLATAVPTEAREAREGRGAVEPIDLDPDENTTEAWPEEDER